MAYAKIRPRRGNNYEWSTMNPVLEEGELAIQYPDSGVGTGFCSFKIGDGVNAWNDLPWAFDGASANSIDGGTPESFHLIKLRAGTAELWETVDPVLKYGEPGFDSTNNSIKVGDGVKRWSELSYIESGGSLSGVYDFGDEGVDSNATLSDLTG